MYDKRITVLGEPQAQKRHRHTNAGKFTRVYDPSQDDKASLRDVIQNEAPEKPLDEPLRIDMIFYFSRPKSHYRTGKNAGILKPDAPLWHTTKPDRDNLDKFIMDAMKGIFLRDDSIVCCGELMKIYDDKPRIEIHIQSICLSRMI